MSIDTAQILGSRPAPRPAGTGQDGLDDFFLKHKQRGQSMEAFRYGFIPSGSFAFADDVFTPEFLQVVGCHARGIRSVLSASDDIHLCGKVGSTESSVIYSQFNYPFGHRPHPGLVDVNASDPCFTNTRGSP